MGCAMTTVCSVQDFLYRNACAKAGIVDAMPGQDDSPDYDVEANNLYAVYSIAGLVLLVLSVGLFR